MDAWHLWVIVALLLVVAEMFNGDFWLVCLGIGALLAAVVSLVVPSVVPGILAFAAGSMVGLVAVRPLLLRRTPGPLCHDTDHNGLPRATAPADRPEPA